jgi:hypothetical protein
MPRVGDSEILPLSNVKRLFWLFRWCLHAFGAKKQGAAEQGLDSLSNHWYSTAFAAAVFSDPPTSPQMIDRYIIWSKLIYIRLQVPTIWCIYTCPDLGWWKQTDGSKCGVTTKSLMRACHGRSIQHRLFRWTRVSRTRPCGLSFSCTIGRYAKQNVCMWNLQCQRTSERHIVLLWFYLLY